MGGRSWGGEGQKVAWPGEVKWEGMGPDCSAVVSLSHFFMLFPCLLGHELQKKLGQGGLAGCQPHSSYSPAVSTLPLCCGQEDLALIKMKKQALGLDSAFAPPWFHRVHLFSDLVSPSEKLESILAWLIMDLACVNPSFLGCLTLPHMGRDRDSFG